MGPQFGRTGRYGKDRQPTENVQCDDPLSFPARAGVHVRRPRRPRPDVSLGYADAYRSSRGATARSHRHGRAIAVPQSAARAGSCSGCRRSAGCCAAAAASERAIFTAAAGALRTAAWSAIFAATSTAGAAFATQYVPPPAPVIATARRAARGRPRPSRPAAAAATLSIRRSTRPRPARRARSAPALRRPSRRRRFRTHLGPAPRQPGAPLDLSGARRRRRGSPSSGGDLPPPPPVNPSAHRRHAGGAAAEQHAQGRIRSRLRLCPAQGLWAGRADVPRFPAQISERPADAGGAILARRKSVSGPAISRCRRIVPRGLDQIRDHRARARRAVAARPVACGARAKRKPPARRSARCCANIRALRSA